SCSRCCTLSEDQARRRVCEPAGFAMAHDPRGSKTRPGAWRRWENTMADPHHEEAGPNLGTYLMVFGALCVCTALSFIVNAVLGHGMGSMMVIMVVAVIKASLVVAIFMHLKFDWDRLYFLIFPVAILAVMMIVVLLPDIVLAWKY